MEYLVTGKEMKLLDQNTSEVFKVPDVVLMEQAAGNFVRELFLLKNNFDKILILCGNGNNGGDGIAVARLLRQMGKDAAIFMAADEAKASKLCKLQLDIYRSYHYPIVDEVQDSYDVIVDAIFGTGLARSVSGEIAKLLQKVNSFTKAYKVALDIASGVSADTGEILGEAFLSDATITFSFKKLGQLLWPGNEYSGKIICTPIGITKESFLEKKPRLASIEEADLKLLPKRTANSNKGSYGKLLLIAGSEDMAGAAVLSARAAYSFGCGMVKVITHENNRTILLSSVPEALCVTYNKSIDKKKIIEAMKWASAIVIGPGIGMGENARELLSVVLMNASVPVLFDADALNLLSEDTSILLRPHTEIVITPHLGEMARLTKNAISYIKTHLCDVSSDFAKQYNVVCVLKDFRTIIADSYGMLYVNQSGNHGMATAGSGDVLTGIIGSILAQGTDTTLAAALGVYCHGKAADIIRGKVGAMGMKASDIVDGIIDLSLKIDD